VQNNRRHVRQLEFWDEMMFQWCQNPIQELIHAFLVTPNLFCILVQDENQNIYLSIYKEMLFIRP
jgi:hypothetical protein